MLTGSALALGSVLALMAIPRALLMIFGGAYVDRLSPRRVMLWSNAVRLVAVLVLGVVVVGGAVELWMLYVFALVFGVADAFFFPAQGAIVPAIVPGEQLQPANAIAQGTAQLTLFVGPALAGLAIAALGTSGANPSVAGIGFALLVDALTFVVSLVSLWLMRGGAKGGTGGESVLGAIREGVSFLVASPTLRVVVVISLAANFLIVGPFEIGLPVLAYARLPEGAAAFGSIMSAFGLGSLVGLGAGAVLPAPRPALFGTVVLLVISISGVCLALLALAYSTPVALALGFAIGVALGYSNLLMITWIQRRIPMGLMGRVMSLVGLSSIGLVPISQLVAGGVVTISLSGMFVVAGVGMTLLTLSALASSRIRGLGTEPVVDDGVPAT